MARMERKPENVATWIEEGNAPPDAGHIQSYLEARGITIGPEGVSIGDDGTITIGDTDATAQKLRAALDAIDPATLDPETFTRETQLAALTSVLAEIRAKPEQGRTPAERAVLLQAGLQGLDSGIVAPVTPPGTEPLPMRSAAAIGRR